MKKNFILVLICLLATTLQLLSQNVYSEKTNGSDTNDGLKWSTAFSTSPNAINQSKTNNGEYEVWGKNSTPAAYANKSEKPYVELSEVHDEYTTYQDINVRAEIYSNEYIDDICGVGYKFYKDGELIENNSDFGTVTYKVRIEKEIYYDGEITDGSGMIEATVGEETIGAFTLGMFDNYCTARNRPIDFTVNARESGVYTMVATIYSCTNAGTPTGTSFVATDCDGEEHLDKVAATCDNPTELSKKEVRITVVDHTAPTIAFSEVLHEYTTNEDINVTAEISSNGLIDQLCGVGYKITKDGETITNIADYGTLTYKVRQVDDEYNGEITNGSGMIEVVAAEDNIGAFTLGMFDTYCVNRNRPVNFTANLTKAGEYKIISTIYSCYNEAIKTISSFNANDICGGGEHFDGIAETCEKPVALTSEEVTITIIPISDIPENIANKISINPNPTNGIINIIGQNIDNITIFNNIGEEIISTKNINIDLTKYPAGMYFVKISANNQVITKKLIKQ